MSTIVCRFAFSVTAGHLSMLNEAAFQMLLEIFDMCGVPSPPAPLPSVLIVRLEVGNKRTLDIVQK